MAKNTSAHIMGREERASFIFSHIALFTVFVWFGALKFFDVSPANPLVTDLYNHTLGVVLPFLSAQGFIYVLGGLEVVIGLCFLIIPLQRIGLILLVPHMITTIMPLFLLSSMTWQSMLTPTLEGQYIIKNIVIIALAASIYVDSKKKYASRLK